MDSKKVIVVGGSFGGLATGLTLNCTGWDVEIFEQSKNELIDRGAGLVVQMELLEYLENHGIVTREAISVPSRFRQSINKNGEIISGEAVFQLMTSWNVVYKQLYDVFPNEKYNHGFSMTKFEKLGNEQIRVHFQNGETRVCDLLIGADGVDSQCRKQVLPNFDVKYSGYLAWRGLIDENDLTDEMLDLVEEKFTLLTMPNSHLLSYLIPSIEGNSKGDRRFNWVWYWNVPEEKLQDIMTDVNGKTHKYFVPPKFVQPKHFENQMKIAKEYFPKILFNLINLTKDPFIQPVYDVAVPKMVFGNVCLVGDAAFIPRPHTASGVSKAVTNAIDLAENLKKFSGNIEQALSEWEKTELRLGKYLEMIGKQLGRKSQGK